MHKAGFVNIIGNPNVGKSTLMNALVGERLSIITSKAQTTRHRILGVVSGEDFQIVFSDTPGILKPSYKLQESMMKFVTGAVNDADVILYVTDTVEQSDRSNDILEKIRQSDIPTLAVINKIDLTTPEKLEELVDKWQALLPAATIVPVSARENFNIKGLFDLILERLPEGEAFYSKDTLTDKTLRFFASEIIREKILRNYDKEIPYCCEIAIEAYKEEPTIDRISAVIYVARDSQKGILSRAQGRETQKSRTGRPARTWSNSSARRSSWQLYVKVNENWRDNERATQALRVRTRIITTKSGCRGIAQIYPENHPIGDAAEQRRHCRRPIQQRLFLLGQPPLPDEPRISGGDSCAQHPVAGRSGRRRGLFPAGRSQIQPRRPAGCRYRLFGCHRQKTPYSRPPTSTGR